MLLSGPPWVICSLVVQPYDGYYANGGAIINSLMLGGRHNSPIDKLLNRQKHVRGPLEILSCWLQ